MELSIAIEKLKDLVKTSTSLDEFKHLDFTLVAADQRSVYQNALIIIEENIRKGIISREEFEVKVGLK